MNDLEALAAQLLDKASERFKDLSGTDPDEKTVKALADKEAPLEARQDAVRGWLHHYRVLRGIRAEKIDRIAKAVVEYADGARPESLGLDQEVIAEQFHALGARLAVVVGKRNTISMASKALWLCYPDAVPIFDDYAERALQILCRIQGIAVRAQVVGTYERFLNAWLQVHAACLPALDAVPLVTYPYRIRLLDWLLWYLGEPRFDDLP